MDLDLLDYNTKTRPITFSDQNYDQLNKHYGPDLKSKSATFIMDVMKPLTQEHTKDRTTRSRHVKQKKSYVDVPDRKFKTHWPLNPTTCVDWREPTRMQNATRDWPKYVTFTTVEMEIAGSYRQDLLNGSSSAAFLRSTFKKMMDPYCEKRVYETYETPRTKIECSGWHYADPYTTPDDVSPPTIDMPDVITTREARRMEAAERETLTNFMIKVQAMKVFMATTTSKCLDDEVAEAFKLVEAVSIFIRSTTWYIH